MNSSTIQINNTLNSTTNIYWFYPILLTIDEVFRYYSFIVHLVYIVFLIMTKSSQKKTFMYTNVTAITSTFYVFIYFCYMFGTTPSTSSQSFNDFLCSTSEIFWPFSNLIRMYSILLIAIYRYIGVYKVNLYKKINKTNWMLISPIVFITLVSLLIPIVGKYIFQTSPYLNAFCQDGYSPVYANCLNYFIYNTVALAVVPLVLMVFIYVKITTKLYRLRTKMTSGGGNGGGGIRMAENRNSIELNNIDFALSRSTTLLTLFVVKRDTRFIKHLVFICSAVILSTSSAIIINLKNVVPDFWDVFYFWRPILRINALFMASLVPIISFYFHPLRETFLKLFKYKVPARVEPGK